MLAVQGAIFGLQFEITFKLQDLQFQTERLIAYRNALIEKMSGKVLELNRENFAVHQWKFR
jgi:type I restriction enzyme R subunit